ncbi:MAG: M14 family zinc carboxypeptidase [Pseudomonadota bacterium]
MRLVLAALALCVPFAFTAPAAAYEPKPIETLIGQDAEYDVAIPKPEDVVGFSTGQIIFTPEMLHAYLRAVDTASDRVSVDVVGRSHFGRPILRATVTAPQNQSRLEEIRTRQLALATGEAAPTEGDLLVVQFTHGVHGSEPSSYDASAPLLYHLAAAQDAATLEMLETSVINLVVVINPDGANRFAEWTNMHRARVPVADPQHREHFYEWPWGRTNHYWFDLNRQWIPVNQPEAVALVSATHDWSPHLAVDLHEMGRNSTYFFSPGPRDGLHPLLGTDGLELNLQINASLADQMDAEGAVFVSEELFDDFYLGYGSSYPGLLGSVPYLFEQSSVRGIIQETNRGVLRYDDKIGQQARVALSLIRGAHEHRSELLAHKENFAAESRRLAANDPVTHYVFTSADRGRLADFLEMLQVHRIEVRALTQTIRAEGIAFEAGDSYLVATNQANYRVIKGLFETRVIDDKSEFYDVSGWTQPLAYDLDYAEIRRGMFGPAVSNGDPVDFSLAAPAPARSNVAYVMDWRSSWYAPRALNRIVQAGLYARVIPDEIELQTADGLVEPGRGAIMIPVGGQELDADAIHALMERAAAEDGVTVHAAVTSSTPQGSDLGGFRLGDIERPEVLLLTGRGTSMNDAGEIWHLLDHEMEIGVSMIDLTSFANADLDRYTHIILVSGNYSTLGEAGAERLGDWAREGGVLIASRSGARFLVSNEIGAARFAEDEESDDATAEGVELAYEEINQWDAEQSISGALFGVELDLTHPLAFGLTDEDLTVHRIGSAAFAVSDNPFALPARYREDGLLSGYASPENVEALAGLGAVHAERLGAGSVILFADNPYFRAYMRGPARLFTNAIFFGDDFRNPRRRAD